MGVKNTHAVRNTAALATAPLGGFLFSRVERCICPSCGGPVQKLKTRDDTPIGQKVVGFFFAVSLLGVIAGPGWWRFVWVASVLFFGYLGIRTSS